MNPNNKSSNAVWYVIIVLVILVAAYFLFKGNDDNAMMNDGSNMASSTNTGGDAMTGGNTTGGTGANAGGTTGGNVAGTSAGIPSDDVLTALINVSKVRVPQTATDVALSGGTATYKNAGKDARISVGPILGKYVTDNGYDVLVNMSIVKDPAQVVPSHYVAMFFVKDNAATFTSAVYVGEGTKINGKPDAVSNKAVSVDKDPLVFDSQVGYVLTIHYLDRRTAETATTTPTQAKDLVTNVRAHTMTK